MWINGSYTDTTFLFSEKQASTGPTVTSFSFQNGKAKVPTILRTRISRHNSKWRRRVGPVTWWASQQHFFPPTRRPPRPVVYRSPPLPTKPFRGINWDWLASSLGLGLRSRDATPSLPVVGSRFLSLQGNNGEGNGCLSCVSERALSG